MTSLRSLAQWIDTHGGKAATVAAWMTQAAAAVASLASIPLLFRDLGASGAGEWFFILSWSGLFQLCDFGLSQSISRQASFSLARRQPGGRLRKSIFLRVHGGRALAQIHVEARRLFRLITFIILGSGVLLERTVLFSGGMTGSLNGRIAWYLVVAMAAVLNENRADAALLTGCLQIAWLRILGCAASIAQNAALIMALWFKAPLYIVAAVLLGGAALQRLATWLLFRRKIQFSHLPGPKHRLWYALWRMSWQQGVASASAYLIFSVNPLISGYLLGPVQVAAYAVYLRVGNLLLSGLSELVAPQTNFMVKLVSERNWHALLTKFFKILIAVGSAGFFAYLAFAIAGRPVVLLLTHGRAVISEPSLIVLSAYHWLALLQIPCACFILAHGEHRFAVIAAVGAALNVLLAFALIPPLGILGGVLATALAQALTSNWYILRLCAERLRGHARDLGGGALRLALHEAAEGLRAFRL